MLMICHRDYSTRLLYSKMASCSNIKKSVKGKILHSQAKVIVLNVYDNLVKQHPDKSVRDITQMAADLTGVSMSTIYRIRKTTGKVLKNGLIKLFKERTIITLTRDKTKYFKLYKT